MRGGGATSERTQRLLTCRADEVVSERRDSDLIRAAATWGEEAMRVQRHALTSGGRATEFKWLVYNYQIEGLLDDCLLAFIILPLNAS